MAFSHLLMLGVVLAGAFPVQAFTRSVINPCMPTVPPLHHSLVSASPQGLGFQCAPREPRSVSALTPQSAALLAGIVISLTLPKQRKLQCQRMCKEKDDQKNDDKKQEEIYYHYTDRDGAEGIKKSGKIRPSKSDGDDDAVFGDGVYATKLPPDVDTMELFENIYDGGIDNNEDKTDCVCELHPDPDEVREVGKDRDVHIIGDGEDYELKDNDRCYCKKGERREKKKKKKGKD